MFHPGHPQMIIYPQKNSIALQKSPPANLALCLQSVLTSRFVVASACVKGD